MWAQADTSIREMMAKLAQTEKSLKSERLAHAEAKQDAAKLKVCAALTHGTLCAPEAHDEPLIRMSGSASHMHS